VATTPNLPKFISKICAGQVGISAMSIKSFV
jgi:hypothetical protein